MVRQLTIAGVASAIAGAMLPISASAAETVLFNSFVPPKHIINVGIIYPWIKNIERVTEGRVKMKLPAKNLAPPPRQFDVVTQQIADGAYIFNAFLQKRVPLVQLSLLPLVSVSGEANAVALWRTYKKYFEAKNQYKGVELLGVFAGNGGHIASLKEPITSIAQLKTMKTWSLPATPAKALKVLGVTVVPGPAVRIYPIVSKGTVDAFSGLSIGESYRFKVAQFAKAFTIVPGAVFSPSFSLFLSPQKWKKISKKDQALMRSVSGEALGRLSRAWDEGDAPFADIARKDGKKVVVAPPAMMADLRKAWTPFQDQWIAQANKQGVDGRAAMNFFLSEVKKVGAEKK